MGKVPSFDATPPPIPGEPTAPSQKVNEQAQSQESRSRLKQFLSGTTPATDADVTKFLEGILKFFAALMKKEQEAHKRASDQMKKSLEGDQ